MATVSQPIFSCSNVQTFQQSVYICTILLHISFQEQENIKHKLQELNNLPHWQENSKYRAYFPSKTSIIPPHTFRDRFSSPRSNVVFPWHLQFGMPHRVVPCYQEFYFHSLNINTCCYSLQIACKPSNNINYDPNRSKCCECWVDTINKHDMVLSYYMIRHAPHHTSVTILIHSSSYGLQQDTDKYTYATTF
jgi:hypothetical protein